MPMRFTMVFYGEAQIDRTMLNVEEAVKDATPVWNEIADRYVAAEKRQFATQGGSSSGGWPELSPTYAAWKAKHYPGKKILVRTGALKASLTQRPFGVEHITPDSMVIGSDVSYGRFHQLGLGVPVRRPVEFTENQRRIWIQLIQKHIKGEYAT